jgi:hypothetical protein
MTGSFGSFLILSAVGIALGLTAWIAGCSSEGITPICPANTDSCVTLPGDAAPPSPDSGVK